jgi:protein-tyrosine phosphatase
MQALVYWIEGPWPGRLAIVPRPRGGDWLEDEVQAWRSAGIDVIVSFLSAQEMAEWELAREPELCEANSIHFVHLPIPDRQVPTSHSAVAEVAHSLEQHLQAEKNVAVHCRAGIGRSSLFAASLLVLGGVSPEDAFERIRAARGCPVPDTVEQRDWVTRFAHHVTALAASPAPH